MSSSQYTKDAGPRVFKYRWLVLFVYSLLSMATSTLLVSYAGNSHAVAAYYNLEVVYVEALALIPMLMYPFVTLLTIPAFNKNDKRTRVSMYVVSLLVGLAGWVRVIGYEGPEGFAWLIFGQVLLGIAQPFVLNYCTLLSDLWFDVKSRHIATSVGVFSQFLGVTVAYFTGPAFFSDTRHSKQDMFYFALFYGIMSTLAGVSMCVVFRSKPPVPPTNVPVADISLKDTFKGVVKLGKSWHVMFLLYICTVVYAVIQTIPMVLTDVLRIETGYNDFAILEVWIAFFSAGLLGVLGAMRVFWLRPFYIIWIKVLCGKLLIALMVHTLGCMYQWQKAALGTPTGVVGLVGATLLPIGLELFAEYTFPLPANIGAGIIFMLGQLLSSIFIMTFRWGQKPVHYEDYDVRTFHNTTEYNIPQWLMFGVAAPSAILALALPIYKKDKYKRRMANDELGEANRALGAMNEDALETIGEDKPLLTYAA